MKPIIFPAPLPMGVHTQPSIIDMDRQLIVEYQVRGQWFRLRRTTTGAKVRTTIRKINPPKVKPYD